MKKSAKYLALGVAVSVLFAAGCAAPLPSGTPTAAPPKTPEPTREVSQAPLAAATPSASAAPVKKPEMIHLTYHSDAISKNMIKEIPDQDIYVVLPPAYDAEKRYPVVYFVSGFSMPTSTFPNHAAIEFASGVDADFILVAINAYNKYGGSFMVNSPVTGNWEDFAVKEAIALIDGKYKTIQSAKGRGIAGFSMGGFVAINLAMRHPDIYSAAYALSPGLFDTNGLADAMKTWAGDTSFLTGYGQAFCPMPDKPDGYTEIPKLDGSKNDTVIAAKWEAGYGGLQAKIDAYLALKTPLKAIALEYGTSDMYGWIPKGCEYFSTLLKQNGIENTLTTFKGGHNVPSTFVADSLAPFFQKVFAD